MSETRTDCAHDWVPMVGGEVCYGCNSIRRYDSVTYTAPEPIPATPPTPDLAAVRRELLAVLNCVEDDPEAYEACERLCAALQVSREDGFDGIADALLGPAPSGGEVEKWHRSDCDSKVMGEDACDSWCGAAKCRTRAIAAAPRPEPGDLRP